MKYTKEFLTPLVQESSSMSEVVRKIGLRTDSGSATHIAKIVRKFGIDFSHFKTRAQQIRDRGLTDATPIEDFLSNKKAINSSLLRKRIIACGIKKNQCEKCGILDWHGEYLCFQLHHKDSNHYNNNIENLMIVCPNCHVCIHDKEKNEKMKKKKAKLLVGDNKKVANLRVEKRKVARPKYSQLKQEIDNTNYSVVAKKYGVSGNAVRKWMKMYEKYNILD